MKITSNIRFYFYILIVMVFPLLGVNHNLSISSNEYKSIDKLRFEMKHHYSISSLEMDDANLLESVVFGGMNVSSTAIKILATLIRISTDTIAGISGSLVKYTGGFMNLVSNLLFKLSLRVQNKYLHECKVCPLLNSSANAIKGLGNTCLWGGDVVESLIAALGRALQDSFRALHTLPIAAKYVLTFLLHNYIHYDKNTYIAQHGVGAQFVDILVSGVVVNNDSSSCDDDNFNSSRHNNRHIPSEDDMSHMRFRTNTTRVNRHSTVVGSKLAGRQRTSSVHSTEHSDKGVENQFRADPSLFMRLEGNYEDSFLAEPGLQSSSLDDLDLLSSEDSEQSLFSHFYDSVVNLSSLFFSDRSSGGTFTDGNYNYPSISSYLFVGLLLISVVNLMEYSSVVRRCSALLITFVVVWFSIVCIHHDQMKRFEAKTRITTMHSVLTIQSQNPLTPRSSDHRYFESVTWLNSFVNTVWSVDSGGLGEYVNEMYADILKAELAQIPPAVATIYLKSFNLGSTAPLIKGLRVVAYENDSCVAEAADRARHEHENLLHPLKGQRNSAMKLRDLILEAIETFRDKGQDGAFPHGGHRSSDNTFSSECGHLVVDMDVVFASSNLNVETSLRHTESQSVLPEVTVLLNEVLLAGQVRMTVSLTSDYPFVGNATISFLNPPVLDFAVSSFGGVDLSSIPLAYYWMNKTMQSVLKQYTYPSTVSVDMRQLLCPSCVTSSSQLTGDVLLDSLHMAQRRVLDGIGIMEGLIARERERFTTAVRTTRSFALKVAKAAHVLYGQVLSPSRRQLLDRWRGGVRHRLLKLGVQMETVVSDIVTSKHTVYSADVAVSTVEKVAGKMKRTFRGIKRLLLPDDIKQDVVEFLYY